jgi:ribonuclease E
MTRKRIGTGLLEAFSENCDHCGGRGLILHDEPKESRRRSEGRNGQEQKAGPDEGAAAKKTSRRRGRGRGRGEDEQPEAEPQQQKDVALRVAQIAAASALADAKKTDEPAVAVDASTTEASVAGEPTGYPVSAAGDQSESPEATGFPDAGASASTVVPEQAETDTTEQNGSGRSGTRRRRSSRGRGKAADQQGEAGDSGTGEAAALVSTGN